MNDSAFFALHIAMIKRFSFDLGPTTAGSKIPRNAANFQPVSETPDVEQNDLNRCAAKLIEEAGPICAETEVKNTECADGPRTKSRQRE